MLGINGYRVKKLLATVKLSELLYYNKNAMTQQTISKHTEILTSVYTEKKINYAQCSQFCFLLRTFHCKSISSPHASPSSTTSHWATCEHSQWL